MNLNTSSMKHVCSILYTYTYQEASARRYPCFLPFYASSWSLMFLKESVGPASHISCPYYRYIMLLIKHDEDHAQLEIRKSQSDAHDMDIWSTQLSTTHKKRRIATPHCLHSSITSSSYFSSNVRNPALCLSPGQNLVL